MKKYLLTMAFALFASCAAYAQSSSTEEATPAQTIYVTGATVSVVYTDGHAQKPRQQGGLWIYPGTYTNTTIIINGQECYVCSGSQGECVVFNPNP
jgi:hypothetical protein